VDFLLNNKLKGILMNEDKLTHSNLNLVTEEVKKQQNSFSKRDISEVCELPFSTVDLFIDRLVQNNQVEKMKLGLFKYIC
jgi:hypothetical protein